MAFTVGARDYKGVQCVSYQEITGSPTPGAHPGSYNGQDAYSDMLVVDDGTLCNGISSGERRDNAGGGCPTLNASHEQPIMLGSKKQHAGVTQDGTSTTLTSQEKERPIVGTSVVRRLTPLECSRLQGMPDGWCDIGDWTDSKGKKHKDADSPKYKALGNGIALPFWAVLLKRISAQYERPATLGSLFDGIGSFPLAWARLNGPKNCRWSSEIEEFPIAVTKKHFGDEETGDPGDIRDYL